MGKINTIRLLSIVFGIMFAGTTNAAAGHTPETCLSRHIETLRGVIEQKDQEIANLKRAERDDGKKV